MSAPFETAVFQNRLTREKHKTQVAKHAELVFT